MVRFTAIEALGKIGPDAKAAVATLTEESLKDKDRHNVQRAANTLGKIGPYAKTAIPALTELLKGKDQGYQYAAAEALGERSAPRQRSPSPPSQDYLSVGIVMFARLLPSPSETGPEAKAAVRDLADLAKDTEKNYEVVNYEVRSYAIEALGKIGVTAIPSLAELLKSKDVLKSKDGFIRHRVITALVRIGPAAKTAIPTLMELIQNEDSEDSVRYVYITEGFGKIGPVAVPALTELCKNKNEEVRDEAVEALGKIGPAAKTAVPTLMKLLADESVRRGAASALGNIGSVLDAKIRHSRPH